MNRFVEAPGLLSKLRLEGDDEDYNTLKREDARIASLIQKKTGMPLTKKMFNKKEPDGFFDPKEAKFWKSK